MRAMRWARSTRLSGATGLLVVAALAVGPAPGRGQEAAADGLFRIDVEVVYGTLALGWPTAPGWVLGADLGAGISDGIVSLAGGRVPGEELEFEPVVHVGGFLNRALSSKSALELGARIGFADILEGVCPASDCLPESFGSLHVGWEIGGDTFRGATRMLVVRQEGRTLLVWRPLFLRMRF